MKTLLTLGITGGIGAGKSVVSRVLRALGIAVFDCDTEAKKLYDTDEVLKEFMVNTFGKSLYDTPQGTLNRPLLAQKIFSDKASLLKVEKEVHQRTTDTFIKWRAKQEGLYCALESAILYKVPLLYTLCDRIIQVTAPEELRIKRVQKRDCATFDEVQKRIESQNISTTSFGKLPCYTLVNDDKRPLLPQILSLHKELTIDKLPYKD